jgi:hypothetical protein
VGRGAANATGPGREDRCVRIPLGRLQDHIGEKLIPRFAALLGESPKSLLDVLAYAERMEWITSAEEFVGARRLRNLLVHEYMSNAALFLEALLAADRGARLMLAIVDRLREQARAIGL